MAPSKRSLRMKKNLKIKKNADWLKALIWADRLERLEKIEQAIEIAKKEVIQFKKAQTIIEFEKIKDAIFGWWKKNHLATVI